MSEPAAMANARVDAAPTVSVIIPSYNRCASLQRAILSLCAQDTPLTRVEVIVVLDGSRDGSGDMLAGLQLPFHLSVIEQTNQGAAVARNQGAARASGEVLVFMDDDMEADRLFLAEHARLHVAGDARVILGLYASNLDRAPSYFVDELRGWWAAMFRRMRAAGHRYAYTDLLSGNFSLRRTLFQRIGGFNTALRCHEDYELGYRLLEAGAEFRFVEVATCTHHEQSDLRRTLLRKVAEGIADVQLGRLHPRLKTVLPMRGLPGHMALPSRILMHLAFGFPALGDLLARVCERALGPLERVRRYATWRRVLSGLIIYWYWRGVAYELPSIRRLNEFLFAADAEPEQPELIVRLEEGLDAAMACLDDVRPAAAAFFYRGHLIGRIPPLAGTEPLSGRHLRPLLWEHFRAPLLRALAETGPTGFLLLDERLRELAAQSIRT